MYLQMSRLMGKPTICIGENKDAVTAKLISAFVFTTRIVQFLFYLNPKFQASSSFLCLYRSVCVRPVWKPHCWFSHEAAQIITTTFLFSAKRFLEQYFSVESPTDSHPALSTLNRLCIATEKLTIEVRLKNYLFS